MANFPLRKTLGFALKALLPSSWANNIDLDHTKAPNFDEGSTHAPTGDIIVSGSGGKTIKLDSAAKIQFVDARTITKILQTTPHFGAGGTDWLVTQSASIINATLGGKVWWSCDLPPGAIVLQVRVSYTGNGSHLPTNKPIVAFVTRAANTDAAWAVFTSIVDPSASGAAFAAQHWITLPIASAPFDGTFHMAVQVTAEDTGGGSPTTGATIQGVEITYTVAEHRVG